MGIFIGRFGFAVWPRYMPTAFLYLHYLREKGTQILYTNTNCCILPGRACVFRWFGGWSLPVCLRRSCQPRFWKRRGHPVSPTPPPLPAILYALPRQCLPRCPYSLYRPSTKDLIVLENKRTHAHENNTYNCSPETRVNIFDIRY